MTPSDGELLADDDRRLGALLALVGRPGIRDELTEALSALARGTNDDERERVHAAWRYDITTRLRHAIEHPTADALRALSGVLASSRPAAMSLRTELVALASRWERATSGRVREDARHDLIAWFTRRARLIELEVRAVVRGSA